MNRNQSIGLFLFLLAGCALLGTLSVKHSGINFHQNGEATTAEQMLESSPMDTVVSVEFLHNAFAEEDKCYFFSQTQLENIALSKKMEGAVFKRKFVNGSEFTEITYGQKSLLPDAKLVYTAKGKKPPVHIRYVTSSTDEVLFFKKTPDLLFKRQKIEYLSAE